MITEIRFVKEVRVPGLVGTRPSAVATEGLTIMHDSTFVRLQRGAEVRLVPLSNVADMLLSPEPSPELAAPATAVKKGAKK
jgi:hypothetical protein